MVLGPAVPLLSIRRRGSLSLVCVNGIQVVNLDLETEDLVLQREQNAVVGRVEAAIDGFHGRAAHVARNLGRQQAVAVEADVARHGTGGGSGGHGDGRLRRGRRGRKNRRRRSRRRRVEVGKGGSGSAARGRLRDTVLGAGVLLLGILLRAGEAQVEARGKLRRRRLAGGDGVFGVLGAPAQVEAGGLTLREGLASGSSGRGGSGRRGGGLSDATSGL